MKKLKALNTFVLLGVALSLIGCKGSDVKQPCIGSTSEDYRLLAGDVISAGMFPAIDIVECFGSDCDSPATAHFRAKMKSSDSNLDEFRIITKDEDINALKSKPPYMLSGKKYSFCGHKVEDQLQAGRKVFLIDTETIKALD